MNSMRKYYLMLLLFCNSASPHSLDTTLTGTTASRVITYTPIFGEYDYAKGFIEFQNGFTCTSDPTDYMGTKVPQVGINGPVKGTINLNQGAIKLTQDLHLHDTFNILGANSFPQNNNVKGCVFLGGKTLFLDNNLTLTAGYLCFSDDGTIDGQGHTITLNGGILQVAFEARGAGDAYYPNPAMNLTLKNLTIYNAHNTNLIQNFPAHTHAGYTNLTLDNVTFKFPPNNTLTINPRSLIISNLASFVGYKSTINVIVNGGYPFFGAISILHNSRFYMGPTTTYLSYMPGIEQAPMVFQDRTSEFFLDSATFSMGAVNSSRVFTGGTFVINGICTFYTNTTYTTFGGSTATDDMDIIFLPSARLKVLSESTGSSNQNFVFNNNNSASYF